VIFLLQIVINAILAVDKLHQDQTPLSSWQTVYGFPPNLSLNFKLKHPNLRTWGDLGLYYSITLTFLCARVFLCVV